MKPNNSGVALITSQSGNEIFENSQQRFSIRERVQRTPEKKKKKKAPAQLTRTLLAERNESLIIHSVQIYIPRRN